MDELTVKATFEAELPAGYRFDAKDLALLSTAQRIVDRIQQLEVELEKTGFMIEGSQGQPRLNPIVAEVRLQQATLARVLDGVHLPAEADEEKKSSRHQRAARVRWDREATSG